MGLYSSVIEFRYGSVLTENGSRCESTKVDIGLYSSVVEVDVGLCSKVWEEHMKFK